MASKKILCQFDVQAITSLSNPGAGYVGFSAKADGLYQKIGAASDLRLITTADFGSYQPLDADLTAIAALAGTTGFLKKTAANTWSLDTAAYALTSHLHAGVYEPVLGNPATNGFILSSTTAGVRSWITPPFVAHAITNHSDVSFTYYPSDGDLIQYNGTAWTQRSIGACGIAQLAGSLTQNFSVAALSIEAGTYDWLISGSGGVLTFSNAAPSSWDISFVSGRITTGGAMPDRIAHFDANSTLTDLDTATYPSLTELSYLKGIAGAIDNTYAQKAGSYTQTFNASQINIEAGTYEFQIKKVGADLTFTQFSSTAATFSTSTGITTLGITLSGETASQILWMDSAKRIRSLPIATYPTIAQLAFVRGVTSNIQTQITARALLAGATTQAFSTANLSVTGTVIATSTIKGTLGIFTGLADNRVPYHVNDTTGLNDSAISADGSNMTINGGKINLKTLTDPTHFLYLSAEWITFNTNTGFKIEDYNGGGAVITRFSITALGVANFTGAVTATGIITGSEVYRTSSRELKYDIENFTGSAMCILNKTKIMSYRMKSDYSFALGFIAEDTHPWLSGDDQKNHIFGNHLAILTKAIQEEDTKILQLQKEVKELKNQIKKIQDGRG